MPFAAISTAYLLCKVGSSYKCNKFCSFFLHIFLMQLLCLHLYVSAWPQQFSLMLWQGLQRRQLLLQHICTKSLVLHICSSEEVHLEDMILRSEKNVRWQVMANVTFKCYLFHQPNLPITSKLKYTCMPDIVSSTYIRSSFLNIFGCKR